MEPTRDLRLLLLQLKKLEYVAKTPQTSSMAMPQCMDEYRFLRTEMEAIWNQTYTTLNFFVAFIGVIIGAVFARNIQGWDRLTLFVAVSFVTAAGYRIIGLHTSRVWRIATYM